MFSLLLVLTALVGLVFVSARVWSHRRNDRGQLDVVSAQLATEARMDALTRATLAEMRRIAREASREQRS